MLLCHMPSVWLGRRCLRTDEVRGRVTEHINGVTLLNVVVQLKGKVRGGSLGVGVLMDLHTVVGMAQMHDEHVKVPGSAGA